MKPLLSTVVAVCLLAAVYAAPDKTEENKNLSQRKDPIVESEDNESQKREERCTNCGNFNVGFKGHSDVLARIQAIPGAEIHTQQSFEGCSSDKGCAGLKVKDGRVVERFGNPDAFRQAAAADSANEFQFHAAGSLGNVFEGGVPNGGPYWWMNENSPFKAAAAGGGGSFEKFSKSSSSYSNTGNAGGSGSGASFGASLDLSGNPFLNGEVKPASFQSSSYESASFSTSNKGGEVDISKNPFLNGGFNKAGAGFQAQSGFSGSQYGGQNFGASQASQASYSSGNKFGAGYTGSSPSPFTASTGGSSVNLIQNRQKANEFEFEQQQQQQQNIDDAFQGTGNVHAHEHSGGELQQTCAGQGYVCVHKAQCNNGVVNTNGVNLLQAKTKKQYCNTKTEICCRIEVASLTGAGGLQGSLGVGSATFQGSGSQGSGLFVSSSQAGGQGAAGQGFGQSGSAGQSGFAANGASQSGFAANGASQSGFAANGAGQSGFAGNGAGQSGFAANGAAGQSGFAANGAGQNGFAANGAGQSGFASQSGTSSQSAFGQSGISGNGVSGSGISGQRGIAGQAGQNGFGQAGQAGQSGFGSSSFESSSSSSSFGSRGTNGGTGFGVGATFGTGVGANGNGLAGNGVAGNGANGFGAGSVNRGVTLESSSSSFESRGTNGFNGNKFGTGSTNFGATGFGSTVAPVATNTGTVYKQTSQTNFVETDSFSSGSDNAGVFRPGSLKPGIPYLPPADSSISATGVSSTVFPTTFVTSPRPFTPVKPTYLPPVTSTSAPGYLPPVIPEQSITSETRVPGPTYTEGGIILDETRQPPRKPFVPTNNEVPSGCAAALKCTPIEFCTAEGVISNTSVALTRDQEAYRVPLTDCKDLSTGTVGKCCRDPYYTDPWPTNQLGKWVKGVFGGNDGQYTPDSRGSGSINRPAVSVTVRPPITGSVLLNNVRAPAAKPTVPTFGPNQVTPGFPSSTVSQSSFGQKGQFEIRGQGQFGQGGQGQYTQGGVGQFGVAGQGAQGSQGGFSQSSQSSFSQSNFNSGASQLGAAQGQAQLAGQGQLVSQGQGQLVSQGQGQLVSQGQGQLVSQGQGAFVQQGAGAFGQGSRGQFGAGQLEIQGAGAQGSQGQFSQSSQTSKGFGQAVIAGQGQSVSQGFGQGVRQGSGFSVSQGSGFNVENEYSESVQRVFLSQYTAGGQCGVFNGQKPYGNRNENEVDFAEIPWQAMVLLQTNKSLLCGGVITRPDVVITSAACVDGLEAKNVLIKGGEWKLGIDDEPLPFQIVQVKNILRHPFYKRGSLHYDAAILVLSENLRFSKNIYPICLPRSGETLDAFYNGAGECIVTGWGKQVLQAHLAGAIMHSLNVSLLNPGECQAKLQTDYPHLLENYDQDSCACGVPTNPTNNICRVDIGSALACTTDSVHWVLRGVYSWDSGCQLGNQLAAFYKFDLEWYEWAIGLIESSRFAQFTSGSAILGQNRFAQPIKGSQVSGVKGGVKGGASGFGVKGQSSFSQSSFGSQRQSGFGAGQAGFGAQGQAAFGGQGQATFGGQGQAAFGAKGQATFGGQGQNGFGAQGFGGQFSQQGFSQYSSSAAQTSSEGFGATVKGPTANSFSASYSEKKVFQTEPKIITYTTKPEIVTFTTKPEYFTFTTKPKIVTYTTKPQIIRYETSGSVTNPQYVAPGVTVNPNFGDVVGAHSHTDCKCLEGKK